MPQIFPIGVAVSGTKAAMTQQSLDLLRRRYVVERRPLEASVERILRADTRAGARAILAMIDKRRSENRSEGQRLRKMLRFETSLWDSGCHAVAGVDEAGMSPLAGPVSAAAVILKPGTRIIGVDDSKKLDRAAREELAAEIKERGRELVRHVRRGRGDRRDQHLLGGHPSDAACGLRDLPSMPQHLLIDAKRLKEIDIPQQAIIKGDAKSASIAAASILAKVERDAVMRMLDARHPGLWVRRPQGLSGQRALCGARSARRVRGPSTVVRAHTQGSRFAASCRLGPPHPNAPPAELASSDRATSVIFGTVTFRARRRPPSCQNEARDRPAGEAHPCSSIPRTLPRRRGTAGPRSLRLRPSL